MDLKASFQATTEELSTSIASRQGAFPSPVQQGVNEAGPDSITWFNPLSSDQKSQAARFSLPDWLKWPKGTSLCLSPMDIVQGWWNEVCQDASCGLWFYVQQQKWGSTQLQKMPINNIFKN